MKASAELSATDYLRMLRRWRWLVAIILLGSLAAAAAWSAATPKRYEAQSEVIVRTVTNQQFFPLGESVGGRLTRSVRSELEFLRTDLFRDSARADFPADSSVTASSPDESSLLVFTSKGPSPEAARDAANRYGEWYVAERHRIDQAEVESTIGTLERTIVDLDTQIAGILEPLSPIDDAIDRATDPDTISVLTTRRLTLQQSLSSELAPLETQRRELQARLATQRADREFMTAPDVSAQFGRAATLPTSPSSPNWPQNLLLGLLFGSLVAMMATGFAESISDRLRNSEQLTETSRLPVMAELPAVSKASNLDLPQLLNGQGGGYVEAMESLITSLRILDGEQPNQVLMITSSGAGDGKSTAAAVLAALLGRRGEKVVILGADMRRPTVHTHFRLANTRGLTSYLAGQSDLDSVLFPSDVANQNVTVLPGGPPADDIVNLLRNPRFEELIATLRERFDRVIIDTPPLLPVTDAIEIGRSADATLLLARIGKSRQSGIERATLLLDRAGINTAGLVINGSTAARQQYAPYRS